eukprot:2331045-Amphidinium_carterae.1
MATMEDTVRHLQERMVQMEQGYTAQITQLQGQVQTLHGQLQAAAAPAVTVTSVGPTIDTKLLGKPEQFTGANWKDWSVVMRSYAAVSIPELKVLMERSHHTEDDVSNTVLTPEQSAASQQLFYMLIMTCRDAPLTRIINAGEGQGLRAWRSLCRHFEPASATRAASLLLEALAFSFAGDLQTRFEEFDRVLAKYEAMSKSKVADDIRVGVVVRQLPEGALKQHVLLNMDRLDTYSKVRAELIGVLRAQQAANPGTGPMDIGALGHQSTQGSLGKGKGRDKGAKDRSKIGPCDLCGKMGHLKKDCWQGQQKGKGKGKPNQPKGGQQQQQQQNNQQQQGGKDRKNIKCWACGKRGHTQAECRSRGGRVATLEEQQQQQPAEQGQAQSGGTGSPLSGLFLASLGVCAMHSAPASQPPATSHRLRLGVDSGSAATVLPTSLSSTLTAKVDQQTGHTYETATGQKVKDQGQVQVIGKDVNGEIKGIRARSIPGVSKALISVNDLLETGHKVIFQKDAQGADASHAIHVQTGHCVPFVFKNRTWEIELELMDG